MVMVKNKQNRAGQTSASGFGDGPARPARLPADADAWDAAFRVGKNGFPPLRYREVIDMWRNLS